MSTKYPGGVISKTAPVPSGPYADSTAPGIWTLEQQAAYAKLGQWPTAGNANPNSFIENLFSTYLYTGNGSTQTITNGIDLSTYGGLVWTKVRNGAFDHSLYDSARGFQNILISNSTAGSSNASPFGLTALTTGFTDAAGWSSAYNLATWTFRKQPKFFDVVTWTGDSNSYQIIPHNLGSTPGCVIVKNITTTGDWGVWHRSTGTQNLVLNSTSAAGATYVDKISADATDITVVSPFKTSGETYVAYVFAHNAGGFGLTGTDNVISCGSYTAAASAVTVNLGYEPQWVMVKSATNAANWLIIDTMRGAPNTTAGSGWANLYPNTSGAEQNFYSMITPTATGFIVDQNVNQSSLVNGSGTYIYIAIRRGPMKVPTSGTSVFNALSRTGTAATATVSTTILPDLVMSQARGGMYNVFYDRLRGAGATLSPNLGTDAESAVSNGITAFNNTSYTVGTDASQNRINWNTYTYANWLFSRAPSFFDEVCYTGNSTARTINHNLGVVPEMMIVKCRSTDGNWLVYHAAMGNTKYFRMNTSDAVLTATIWNDTTPTSTVFSVGAGSTENGNTNTYVWYGFATCAGVSKVGSYTGTGATQTINCGFGAGGSRFVLIKRTDSTGDWYVWDSARGMVSGTDPSLLLNSTAAEVNANSIYTISTGFQIVSTAAGINASGGSYIFLSIA